MNGLGRTQLAMGDNGVVMASTISLDLFAHVIRGCGDNMCRIPLMHHKRRDDVANAEEAGCSRSS